MKNKAVFLDRDGTINKKRGDYVKSWNEFKFLEGVAEALRIFSDLDYKIIIVTNQSAVNRKIISSEILADIHQRMLNEFNKEDVRIDAIFYCPHKPEEGCNCRKPKPGLLLKAIKEFDLEPRLCLLIGDSETDIEAGIQAGIKSFLINDDTTLLDITKELIKNHN